MYQNRNILKEKRYLNMSPKELLYIEDALGHTQQIKNVCTDFSTQLQDTELSNFVQQIAQKQQQVFEKFYGLL